MMAIATQGLIVDMSDYFNVKDLELEGKTDMAFFRGGDSQTGCRGNASYIDRPPFERFVKNLTEWEKL
jgi:hypothetical protein